MTTRYPLEPLLTATGLTRRNPGARSTDGTLTGHLGLAQILGVSARSITSWHTHGLTPHRADQAATHLGLHPSTIWPTWFHDTPGDHDWPADDPTLFPAPDWYTGPWPTPEPAKSPNDPPPIDQTPTGQTFPIWVA